MYGLLGDCLVNRHLREFGQGASKGISPSVRILCDRVHQVVVRCGPMQCRKPRKTGLFCIHCPWPRNIPRIDLHQCGEGDLTVAFSPMDRIRGVESPTDYLAGDRKIAGTTGRKRMSKKTAFWIFLIGTLSSGALFLWATYDTNRQITTLSHVDKLSDEVVAGKRVFERHNCNDCHTILGFGGYTRRI